MAEQVEKSPRIVIIGAGMSGLCLAIRLKQSGMDNITILEKSDDVGGTWLDNSYPNSGCDIPSFLYSFSFAPKYDWTMKYGRQPEIIDYFRECADRFGVRELIQFDTTVERADYDEKTATWSIRTISGEELIADILVSAVGQLNRPRIPELDGLNEYQGECWHSARWNHEFDLTGKTIAIIGNGASAIQFIPEVAQAAKKTYLFQRTPSWIHSLNNYRYSTWAKWAFRNLPFVAKLHRLWIFLMCEWRIIAFSEGSLANRAYESWLKRNMRRLIPREQWRTLIPKYAPGCKRILLSSNYLQTLQRDDLQLVTEPIVRFDQHAVCTASQSLNVDAVIFATGFDATGFLQPMKIHGRNHASLHDQWGARPKTYLGLATPGFPNLFFLYGPNTNLGHNSIIFMVEQQVNYLVKCLQKMTSSGFHEVEVKSAATEAFDRDVQARLRNSVWSGDCTSWYKSADGTIPNNWWGSASAYRRRLKQPDYSSFNFVRIERERALASNE